jgi:hypothetical protein
LVIRTTEGSDTMNLMQQCWEMERELEGMGIIGGGMIGGPPLFLLLPVLFFVWALGLGVVAAAGVWAVRQFREQG